MSEDAPHITMAELEAMGIPESDYSKLQVLSTTVRVDAITAVVQLPDGSHRTVTGKLTATVGATVKPTATIGRPKHNTELMMPGTLTLAPNDPGSTILGPALSGKNGWQPDDGEGYPGYPVKKDAAVGWLRMRPAALDLDQRLPAAAIQALQARAQLDVDNLGPQDLQLWMCISNQLTLLQNPDGGFAITYVSYARARGLNAEKVQKNGRQNREAFNDSLRRLANLDFAVTLKRNPKAKKKAGRPDEVRGRMILVEALDREVAVPLKGMSDEYVSVVTTWRVLPGQAWRASYQQNMVGRFPRKLMEYDPHNLGLEVRLGWYLGTQTAIRASYGSLADPISVGVVLHGISEPMPADRRMVAKLRDRLIKALDRLQEDGVLQSWQWAGDTPLGQDLAAARFHYVYGADAMREHLDHHPMARTAWVTDEMQALLPEAGR